MSVAEIFTPAAVRSELAAALVAVTEKVPEALLTKVPALTKFTCNVELSCRYTFPFKACAVTFGALMANTDDDVPTLPLVDASTTDGAVINAPVPVINAVPTPLVAVTWKVPVKVPFGKATVKQHGRVVGLMIVTLPVFVLLT
jgi:hypothetical protein